MKMTNKMLLGLGILGVICAGAALSVGGTTALKADAESLSVNLGAGQFSGSGGSAKITWDESYFVVTQGAGSDYSSPVNQAYISAPRLYLCHYLQFEAADGVEIASITLSASGSKYTGSTIYCSQSPEANGANPEDKVQDVVPVKSGTTLSFTFDEGTRSVSIRNGISSSANTQLRLSAITVDYESTIEEVLPTEIELAAENTTLTSYGSTTVVTATVLPDDAMNKGVMWSSDNPDIATVSDGGEVTAWGNGVANITATSIAAPEVSKSIAITVDTNDDEKMPLDTLLTADVFHTGGYPTEPTFYDSASLAVVYENAYKNGDYIQIRKNPVGYIANVSNLGNIEAITLLPGDGGEYEAHKVTVGTTRSGNTEVELTGTSVNGNLRYEVTEGDYSFFRIASDDSTFKISGFFVEYADADVEAARAWAKSFLDTTAEECEALDVKEETWTSLGESYELLPATAKAALKNETNMALGLTDIQKAMERYDYIATKYGYENFIDRAPAAGYAPVVNAPNGGLDAASIALIAIGGSALLAGAAIVYAKRRKAAHK